MRLLLKSFYRVIGEERLSFAFRGTGTRFSGNSSQSWQASAMKKRSLSLQLVKRNPELHEELQIQAAVAAGDVYTVRRMLERGYSPKIRDANGWTLLHFSAAKSKERCVRVFLEHGADPTVKDLIGGFTALHYAAMHGRARIARLMLESDFCGDIIDAKSYDGWTPLHVAAHYGRDSFVRLLLEFCARVDPLSDKGTTPLQLAIIRERSSCVRILLDHGANIDIQNGFLLRYAVSKGNHSYCRMFLQRGADTNLGRLEDGQTPLHLSALRDDVLCARMLYAYGADTNARNYEGQTPAAVSVSMSRHNRPCLDFLQDVTKRPRSLQDVCRIKIRQCVGLQRLCLLEELPIAKVMKDYLKHKF
ncbi:ankyrin repeat and SOCS box protein 7 isoform X2 [Syngnathus acus]|uniref:ankyrin repeat and SOCS box protein 7 isoform X2 n=2 Tax=Syngnathus acus TaxID=161584 RepID=UPI0018860677|nr:ankyrin repeat and SOCS box protein 7 isoform X2 [Syngnathus acus]XP_037104084.1 ankyrin repeat and SOCS box protein 7 isoform X2 [Syngnathus acus]